VESILGYNSFLATSETRSFVRNMEMMRLLMCVKIAKRWHVWNVIKRPYAIHATRPRAGSVCVLAFVMSVKEISMTIALMFSTVMYVMKCVVKSACLFFFVRVKTAEKGIAWTVKIMTMTCV